MAPRTTLIETIIRKFDTDSKSFVSQLLYVIPKDYRINTSWITLMSLTFFVSTIRGSFVNKVDRVRCIRGLF